MTTSTAPALPAAYVSAYVATLEVALLMSTPALDAALEAADTPVDGGRNAPHGPYRAGMVNALGDVYIARDDA